MTIKLTENKEQFVQLTINCKLPESRTNKSRNHSKIWKETYNLIKEHKCTHCSCGKIDSKTNECDSCLTSKKLMELEVKLQRAVFEYNCDPHKYLFADNNRALQDHRNDLYRKVVSLTLKVEELQREEEHMKTIRFHPMPCGGPRIS